MTQQSPSSTRFGFRRKVVAAAVVAGALAVPFAGFASADSENGKGRNTTEVAVEVLSSGLTYDSIVVTTLPMKGNFQQLIPTASGLTTAYGPGDVGYLGGRWWLDKSEPGTPGHGVMDEGDMFFLCPLLGPGYAA